VQAPNLAVEPLKVVHSVPLWLPQTSPWLYNQVHYLPKSIESHVVAEKVANLDRYGIQNLHTLEDAGRGRYVWDKGLRKLGVRDHLGYLVGQIRQRRARIVHSHWGDWGWRDRGAVRKTGAKHVVTFYGKDVNYIPRLDEWADRYRDLFADVDMVLCEGPHMARCIEKLGCDADKVQVHHLGVEVEKMRYEPRLREPGEPLRALIAASFREKKGIPYAIEALGRVSAEIQVEITIIGDSSEDPRSHPEKERILEALDRWRLVDRTRLLGYQPHDVFLKELYRHHVFVSPSVTASDGDTEGGAPISIIEAVASGMPVATTFHCDIPSVVIHGHTGWLAPEQDAGALADNLLDLLDRPESWQAMSAAGRRHIEDEYSARAQAVKLNDVYGSLSEGNWAALPA
jgi:colanic acid/amylovoran biosynthesis glycosyltransferase